jgi:acyl-CoA synthetase (AMP-forming)/AMP-acid ligase II
MVKARHNYPPITRARLSSTDNRTVLRETTIGSQRIESVMTLSTTVKSIDIPADFPGIIRAQANRRPNATAIVCGENTIDYETLHRTSSRIANALLAAGVRRGDRIAYIGPDSERIYELLIGAAKTGAVLIPINWRLAPTEIAHILSDSGCSLVFVDSAAADVVARAQAENRSSVDSVPMSGFDDWLHDHPDSEPHIVIGRDDPLIQLYTSGTTGRSKGVVVAQRSIYAAWESFCSPEMDWFTLAEDDRLLVAIPSYHMAGVGWAIQGLVAGVPTILVPEFAPGAVMDVIRTEGVTIFVGVPVMFALILAEPAAVPGAFSRLRLCAYGGSPIPETLLAQCIDRFGCDFGQFYGMTETGSSITFLPPSDHTVGNPRLRSAGRPCPGFELAVIDTDGNSLPAGEVGEILLRSPATMVCYWNNPEATANTIVDGWLHTGDAGWVDEDGYLFLCDRIKDMIIVGGENVFPAEVENAIVGHPFVQEAAVIGIPNERWGELVHAFVVMKPGHKVSGRELTEFVREKIAAFKVPRRFDVIDYIPRNATGKILHRQLREDFWRGRDRAIN